MDVASAGVDLGDAFFEGCADEPRAMEEEPADDAVTTAQDELLYAAGAAHVDATASTAVKDKSNDALPSVPLQTEEARRARVPSVRPPPANFISFGYPPMRRGPPARSRPPL